jgi:hypothetical protein
MLLNRAATVMASGQTDSLKDAISAAQGSSTTMKPALDWPEVGASLRSALMQGRNEILPKTWTMNDAPFVSEALRLVAASQASDGHTLQNSPCRKGRASPPADPPANAAWPAADRAPASGAATGNPAARARPSNDAILAAITDAP